MTDVYFEAAEARRALTHWARSTNWTNLLGRPGWSRMKPQRGSGA